MTAAAKTPSQRGRASRNKGAAWERAVANAIKPYWPEAKRSRDNGSINTADTGDIAGTGPALFWSCKDDQSGDMGKPSVIAEWLTEARKKAGPSQMPLVVQKRRGHSDPLAAWCWLWLPDVLDCLGGFHMAANDIPVRMEFRHALRILVAANYALIGQAS